MPPPNPDAIADCVLNAFRALPRKFKPRALNHDRTEWVLLAGIVLSKATGMKCLPHDKLGSAKGNILHDWHAEILAIRGFRRWILEQCRLDARSPSSSEWIRQRKRRQRQEPHKPYGTPAPSNDEGEKQRWTGWPFEMRDGITIHLYVSDTPCGDASMELIMREQADATPWARAAASEAANLARGFDLLGRGHFDRLGSVRRKPARPDAPVSLSKSCSDKLALMQCTGLLGSLAGLMVHPERCYLQTLVLPTDRIVPEAAERAFGKSGRLKGLVDDEIGAEWAADGHAYRPFQVLGTSRCFQYSRQAGEGAVASNLSALWTPNGQEVLINGVLAGRRQFDPKGASSVSRRSLWANAKSLAALLDDDELADVLGKRTYDECKLAGDELTGRKRVKRDVQDLALQGWQRNTGDEDWGL